MAKCPICNSERDNVYEHLQRRRAKGGHGEGPLAAKRHMKNAGMPDPDPPPSPDPNFNPANPGTSPSGPLCMHGYAPDDCPACNNVWCWRLIV